MSIDKSPDLIDFIILIFRKLKEVLFSAVKLADYLFKLTVRHYLIVSLIVVFFSVAGFVYVKSYDKIYQTQALLETYTLSSSDIKILVENLNKADRNEYCELLKINELAAQSILRFKCSYLIDENHDNLVDFIDWNDGVKLNKDTSMRRVRNRILIRAWIKNPEKCLNELNQGLRTYLNSNVYTLTVNQLRIENVTDRLYHVNREIAKLDSYQRKEYFDYRSDHNMANKSQLVFATKDDRYRLFHYELLTLIDKKNSLENELNSFKTPVNFVMPFYKPYKPETSSILIFALFILFGIFMGLLMAHFYEIGKKRETIKTF